MLKNAEIRVGYVYKNAAGECRIVASIDRSKASPVAMWRTCHPELPKGQKAQGSCTISSFARWASTLRPATAEDYAAFEAVVRARQWHTRDHQAIRRIKRAKAQA